VAEIRRDLFLFPEVIDVFVTGRQDALVVVFVGRPRPGEWSRALRSLGYDIPPRRQVAPPPSEVDGQRPIGLGKGIGQQLRRMVGDKRKLPAVLRVAGSGYGY